MPFGLNVSLVTGRVYVGHHGTGCNFARGASRRERMWPIRVAPAMLAADAAASAYRCLMSDREVILLRANPTLFTATLDGVQVCRVAVAEGAGVWEIYSTVTTPGYEGRGFAAQLVGFTLDAAQDAGVSVIPSCWYVDGFMARHADRYDHLRVGHSVPPAPEADACRVAPVVLPVTDPGGTQQDGSS